MVAMAELRLVSVVGVRRAEFFAQLVIGPGPRIGIAHQDGNRRAGGEGDAVAGMLLIQVAGFHVEIESPFAAAGLDAGDALHLGRRLQVLEILRLINEDVIDAKLIKY